MYHVSLISGIIALAIAGILGYVAKLIVLKLDPPKANTAALITFVIVLLVEFGVVL